MKTRQAAHLLSKNLSKAWYVSADRTWLGTGLDLVVDMDVFGGLGCRDRCQKYNDVGDDELWRMKRCLPRRRTVWRWLWKNAWKPRSFQRSGSLICWKTAILFGLHSIIIFLIYMSCSNGCWILNWLAFLRSVTIFIHGIRGSRCLWSMSGTIAICAFVPSTASVGNLLRKCFIRIAMYLWNASSITVSPP